MYASLEGVVLDEVDAVVVQVNDFELSQPSECAPPKPAHNENA